MKTRTKGLLAVPLAAFVLGAAWLFPLPKHGLLARSTPVPGVQPGYQKDDYYWLSDHDLLLFRRVHNPQWTVARRDLNSQTETPLPALERLFQQTGGDPWSVKVSPNHMRLIWAGIGKFIYGATLDGQQFQRWPYGKAEFYLSCWLNDNRHFVRYRAADDAPLPLVMRSVDNPQRVKYLPEIVRHVPPGWTLPRPFPANERLSVEGSSNSVIIISRITVGKIQRIVKSVPLPPTDINEWPSDQRFLSDGDALLWPTSRQPPPKTPAFFWNLLDQLGWRPKPYRMLRVSVSRADGTQWHFVGDFVATDQYPHNFRLLPGGRRFSFEWQDALYTAPVK